jgi:hypothetical protein
VVVVVLFSEYNMEFGIISYGDKRDLFIHLVYSFC